MTRTDAEPATDAETATSLPAWLPRLVAVVAALLLAVLVTGALTASATHPAPLSEAATLSTAESPEPGSVEDFAFESWTTEMSVYLEPHSAEKDRSVAEVTETIVAVFPDHDQNRGIVRTVPLRLGDGTMTVSNIAVHDAHGNEVPFDDDSGSNEFTLEIGDDEYVHGEQTYVITYELRDVIASLSDPERDTADIQEFYANLLPNERIQPLGEFSATVTVAPNLASHRVGLASCYFGVTGEDARCQLDESTSPDGALTYSFAATDLAQNETATINIGFEPGTVPELTLIERSGWLPIVMIVLAPIAVLAAIVLLIVQWRRARHARSDVVVAQYEPRPDLSPHMAAQILPEVRGRTFTAGVVYAAVHDALRIEESLEDTDDGGDDLRQPALRRLEGGAALPEVEQRFVDDVLFANGSTEVVEIDGNTELGAANSQFEQDIADAGIDEGFIVRPEATRRAQSRSLLAAGIAFVVALVALIVGLVTDAWPILPYAGIATGVSVLVFIVALCLPTRLRTPKGAAARDHLRGLREYMKRAEADRIRMLHGADTSQRAPAPTTASGAADSAGATDTPVTTEPNDTTRIIEVYEQLLPYAVLFNLEKTWSRELQAHYETAGTTATWMPIGAVYFASMVSKVDQSAATTQPQSGGGSASGYAGGGFAGGGVGGGAVGGR